MFGDDSVAIIDNPFFKSIVTASPIQIDTIQRPFGYNALYDAAFAHGTNSNMRKEQFFFYSYVDLGLFDINTGDYVLWIWRGDYLNCGPGAEMGVYKKADILGLHWNVIDFTLPMTLSLYDYYYGVFHPVFNWFPYNPQWWITGFNPNETYHGTEKQYMVGSVCFIGHDDMYKTFKEKTKASDLSRFTVFDDKNKTVWISWYDHV